MPISDGYEACKKIFSLFNKEKMFSHLESLIQINDNAMPLKKTPSRRRMQMLREPSNMVQMNSLQRRMPLLVACSSTLSTPELEEELKAIGFSMFIEQPISNDKVFELINILEQREESIEEFDNKI